MNDLDRVFVKTIIEAYKKKEERKSVGNYKYVNGYSTESVAVFKNDITKEAIFSIKGTSQKKEFLLDLKLLMNNPKIDFGQMKIIDRHYKKIKEIMDLKKYKLYTTGHSLGGVKAFYISQNNNNVMGSVFNTFTPMVGTASIELINLYKQSTKLKVIIIKGDILSNEITRYRKGVVELTPSILKLNILSHGIKSFKKF